MKRRQCRLELPPYFKCTCNRAVPPELRHAVYGLSFHTGHTYPFIKARCSYQQAYDVARTYLFWDTNENHGGTYIRCRKDFPILFEDDSSDDSLESVERVEGWTWEAGEDVDLEVRQFPLGPRHIPSSFLPVPHALRRTDIWVHRENPSSSTSSTSDEHDEHERET